MELDRLLRLWKLRNDPKYAGLDDCFEAVRFAIKELIRDRESLYRTSARTD